MAEREFSKISGLPVAIEPIASTTIVEVEDADGNSFKAPFSALGGTPGSHAGSHQDGGSDEIGTDFPTANAIPKADNAGHLNDWVADASTSVKGKVQLAANNESAASKAVQANDSRLSNSRTPTAHAASHIGGTDDLGLGTAAMLDVGVADGVCPLNSSGEVSATFIRNADNTQAAIVAASSKATPVDADTLALIDSQASNELKELPWSGVKATLKTYFDTLYTGAGASGSVDNTSRVAEYTGDGIPQIPDNAAGTTVRQNGFTAVPSGWDVNGGPPTSTFSAGIWKIVADESGEGYYRLSTSGVIIIKYRVLSGTLRLGWSGAFNNYTESTWTTRVFYSASDIVFVHYTTSTCTYEIADIYIGTGAYDTPAKDRAGNGNNLALTAVTPIDGKYGKEMSFNGVTSFAKASSPVIGTGGTIAIRFKRGALGTEQGFFDNSSDVTNGLYSSFSTNNSLSLRVSYDSSIVVYDVGLYASTSNYYTLILCTDGNIYIDGVLFTSYGPTAFIAGIENLLLGRSTSDGGYFNGIISHFRYDSRVWTADEALAWSLNPMSVDSRV